jgi:hypothetical protein
MVISQLGGAFALQAKVNIRKEKAKIKDAQKA